MWLSWSGGKDAALALRALRDVEGLVTTVDETTQRVPIHGVPRRVLEAQARALGLELLAVPLPSPCPNDLYLERVGAALRARAIGQLAFGDLHLEDIRAWREATFRGLGVQTGFPLFGRSATDLLADLAEAQIEARLCSVDTSRLDARLLGRAYDAGLRAELPAECDPLGENGEFHTLVTAIDGRPLVAEAPLDAPARLDDRHLALAWADGA
jgi:diphthamide synthase (EF-2-diphthine--ammonia ligase)